MSSTLPCTQDESERTLSRSSSIMGNKAPFASRADLLCKGNHCLRQSWAMQCGRSGDGKGTKPNLYGCGFIESVWTGSEALKRGLTFPWSGTILDGLEIIREEAVVWNEGSGIVEKIVVDDAHQENKPDLYSCYSFIVAIFSLFCILWAQIKIM